MNNERDDAALIAEAAEMFPPDTVDVQSRYVIVHQLRASADIQDAQTKRETRWADTSDRACLMRKAADALDALLAKLQPPAEPDRAEVLAKQLWNNLSGQMPVYWVRVIREAFDELRAEWEAERPVIDVPDAARNWAESVLNLRGAVNATCAKEAALFILSLTTSAGVRAKPVFSEEVLAIAQSAQAGVLPSNYISYAQVALALARAILGEK